MPPPTACLAGCVLSLDLRPALLMLGSLHSAAGDVNGLRLVRAGAVLAAAAGDVNGLRLVLAPQVKSLPRF